METNIIYTSEAEIYENKELVRMNATMNHDMMQGKWTVDDLVKVLDIPEGGESAVRAYVEKELARAEKHHRGSVDWKQGFISRLQKAIDDGDIEFKGADDEEFIPATQEVAKQALKRLLTEKSAVIAELYEKHAEYNKKYFAGQLSVPVITIEKMSNRTLGNYQPEDASGLKNHIRFNENFIALQLEDDNMERILETLKHEMIHQWQDEVLYAPRGEEPTRMVTILQRDDDGNIGYVEVLQKRRPKEWHNKDFRDMAACVGIPAKGAKCYGNPARMPEAKSYNRKFTCGCVASNGYPVTIWSTRPINATCNICKNRFIEVPKAMTRGKVIEIKMSHVERKGQDAVKDMMLKQYEQFECFASREEKDMFVAALEGPFETGVYQKFHNAYAQGYRYWVAFSGSHPGAVQKGAEDETSVNAASEATQELEQAESETSAAAEPVAVREYSADNPQDIIDLYREEGSTRKVAARLGMAQSTLMGRIKKYQIDFRTGTYVMP
jgi:hypothetical protein